MFIRLAAAVLLFFLPACTAHSPRAVDPPGRPEAAKTRALEAGAAMLQSAAPLEAMDVYLDGFHFHNGEMGKQVEAHHYCSHVNEDLVQCAVFSGNGKDALLMGIEYVVSAKLFATLPDQEKKMWHSHRYEVKSGQLVAPGIPDAAEHELMEKLVSTYGKTWHTWHLSQKERPSLPLGVPALMMGFTADGQVDPALVKERDRIFGIDSQKKRRERGDIPETEILPGADAWQKGEVIQVEKRVRGR
jgi:hypothetical protein